MTTAFQPTLNFLNRLIFTKVMVVAPVEAFRPKLHVRPENFVLYSRAKFLYRLLIWSFGKLYALLLVNIFPTSAQVSKSAKIIKRYQQKCARREIKFIEN